MKYILIVMILICSNVYADNGILLIPDPVYVSGVGGDKCGTWEPTVIQLNYAIGLTTGVAMGTERYGGLTQIEEDNFIEAMIVVTAICEQYPDTTIMQAVLSAIFRQE